jgi:hypothetical protein
MELNINYKNVKQLNAYQIKKHTFNWLNTLHVTFTILRCRLGCWYRQVYISNLSISAFISHYKLNTIQTFAAVNLN